MNEEIKKLTIEVPVKVHKFLKKLAEFQETSMKDVVVDLIYEKYAQKTNLLIPSIGPKVIFEIGKLKMEGMTPNEATKELNKKNVPPPDGIGEWDEKLLSAVMKKM